MSDQERETRILELKRRIVHQFLLISNALDANHRRGGFTPLEYRKLLEDVIICYRALSNITKNATEADAARNYTYKAGELYSALKNGNITKPGQLQDQLLHIFGSGFDRVTAEQINRTLGFAIPEDLLRRAA